MKKMEILEKIYLNPGIHLRELSRKTKLGMPSVKHHVDFFFKENIITKKKEGKNLKLFINFKNKQIISYLYKIEMSRLYNLPKKIENIIFDILSDLQKKPIICIIFGSYANGTYTDQSDLDILLVFNDTNKKIEDKIQLINSRYSIKLELVYLNWLEFKRKFFDYSNDFMKEIKKNKIIVSGIEHWVILENEII